MLKSTSPTAPPRFGEGRKWRVIPAVMPFIFLVTLTGSQAQNILKNGSFETGSLSQYWTTSYVALRSSGWNGITAADGSKFVSVSGPLAAGYSYVELISQSRSAPFGINGLPDNNFVVYLFAFTYLHTTDGRNVSYALMLDPGYGAMGATFRAGGQDQWVTSQTAGYYYSTDPYDPSAPTKPIKVYLQLRDSLLANEYLLLDNVYLQAGMEGAEP